MIDGSAEIMLHTSDLHVDLVQVPLPLSVLAHVGNAFHPDLTQFIPLRIIHYEN